MLAFGLWPGPVSRFDLGSALTLDLFTGTLDSLTDLALLGGANALAIQAGPDVWDIVQARTVARIAPGRLPDPPSCAGSVGWKVRLAILPRPGRGRQFHRARAVVPDSMLGPLPVALGGPGLRSNWRTGPATRQPSDESYAARAFAGFSLPP